MCPHPACSGVGCGALLLRLLGIGALGARLVISRESQQERLCLAFDPQSKHLVASRNNFFDSLEKQTKPPAQREQLTDLHLSPIVVRPPSSPLIERTENLKSFSFPQLLAAVPRFHLILSSPPPLSPLFLSVLFFLFRCLLQSYFLQQCVALTPWADSKPRLT